MHLELGGNNALIVLDDVDVEQAVSVGAFGSFMHQGQICMTTGTAPRRAQSIADKYIEVLAEHADHLPVGNPATEQVALGPIIDEQPARPRAPDRHRQSSTAGARLAAGGTYEGLFYRPTVLADVPTDAPGVHRRRSSARSRRSCRSTRSTRRSSSPTDSEHGLSLGILTRNVMRGLEIADRIPTGIVHINDQTIGDEVVNPFGGVKATGPVADRRRRGEHRGVHPRRSG